MKRIGMYVTALVVPLAMVGCPEERGAMEPIPGMPDERGEGRETMHEDAEGLEDVSRAIASAAEAQAQLQSAPGRNIDGTLYFLEEGGEVFIWGSIRGLDPGVHGIHVHEFGECRGPDFMSAGEHYNPTGEPHGGPFEEQKHLGDLGNVITNERGVAYFSIRATDATVAREGDMSFVGRSLVIHEQPDDYESQPTGGSGDRIACGVIESVRR